MMMFKRDGNTRPATWDDLKPGCVLRETSREEVVGEHDKEVHPTFSDAVIVGISADDRGATLVRLVRPYLYATGAGTACPGWLTGVEDLTVEATRLLGEQSIYRIVLLASGTPHKMER